MLGPHPNPLKNSQSCANTCACWWTPSAAWNKCWSCWSGCNGRYVLCSVKFNQMHHQCFVSLVYCLTNLMSQSEAIFGCIHTSALRAGKQWLVPKMFGRQDLSRRRDEGPLSFSLLLVTSLFCSLVNRFELGIFQDHQRCLEMSSLEPMESGLGG